jgi:DNA-binding transcriptional MocR family regulator
LPAGTTIPLPKRQQLLRLAHKYGIIVVADEVYQLLSFPGTSSAACTDSSSVKMQIHVPAQSDDHDDLFLGQFISWWSAKMLLAL